MNCESSIGLISLEDPHPKGPPPHPPLPDADILLGLLPFFADLLFLLLLNPSKFLSEDLGLPQLHIDILSQTVVEVFVDGHLLKGHVYGRGDVLFTFHGEQLEGL